jgi:DNA anti-recombination protein RmuC
MTSQHRLVHVLAGLALVCSTAAQAQGIWRCGPQGNSFSDRPCADGQAVPAPARPSAEAVQQAADVARREARLAQQLRAQRLEEAHNFQRTQARMQEAAQRAHTEDAGARRQGKKTTDQAEARLDRRATAAPADFSRRSPPVQARVQAPVRTATASARTSPTAARDFPARRD